TALSALGPLVLAAAAEGDAVARAIVADGARELAVAIATTARALGLDAEPVPLALTGGPLLAGEGRRGPGRGGAAGDGGGPGAVQLVAEPALGAVRLAAGR